MSVPPAEIWLYRIVHIDNAEYILRQGMFAKGHPNHDPNYVFIGDTGLTAVRHTYPINLSGAGHLGEYVPFYLRPLSPMLYIICHGYNGVVKRPQRDIVYVCCRLEDVRATGQRIIFTDGHARDRFSTPHDDPAGLSYLDWPIIKLKKWNNDEADHDRRRRKQAECLVQGHVPPECVSRLVVFDEDRLAELTMLVRGSGHTAEVSVNPRGNFYY